MIKINCDKCGKMIDWKTHPAFIFANMNTIVGCATNDDILQQSNFNKIENITVREGASGFRPLDLCPECKQDIYNFIFNKEEQN